MFRNPEEDNNTVDLFIIYECIIKLHEYVEKLKVLKRSSVTEIS